MQDSSIVPVSPSFNSYSSGNLVEAVDRVVAEFNQDTGPENPCGPEEEEADMNPSLHPQQEVQQNNDRHVDEEHSDDEDDFEFTFMCSDPNWPSMSADEIFSDGKIKPLYPINTDNRSEKTSNTFQTSPPTIRLPLKKLLAEEREPTSCSSSDADELDGVPPGTYCVWRPETAPSPGRCKKSNSTGSSKRWKFKDLIHRSNSDGRDSFVFLTPVRSKKRGKEGEVPRNEKIGEVKEEGEKRKSYLPYRQEIVGLFHTVNGLNRNMRQL